MKQQLLTKIHDRTATVAVVGLALRLRSGQGYVGLPLAVAFAEQGFPVTFDYARCRGWH
jgi:UDP-N-acetyl-D-mannosaminuronate dehydrogenase